MNANAEIERLVVEVSKDPLDATRNFNAALEYERLGQTASAVGFYLRAAEYGVDTEPLVVYTSLLRISKCIDDQQDRQISVKHVILQAMSYLPQRPEAYLLLSQYHERMGNWQDCYTLAKVGASMPSRDIPELPADIGFNWYYLKFEQAVSAWWLGKRDESAEIFGALQSNSRLAPEYKIAILNNIARLQDDNVTV